MGLPSPIMRSTLQKVIDLTLVGTDLETFVRSRRADGRSWRLIARDIYEATNWDVTHETLRTWFPEDQEPAA